MRTTTVLSFLAASIAVLSPVYAAPVSTEADSAVAKRQCFGIGSFQNGPTSNTPSNNTNTTLDAVTPDPATGPSSTSTTLEKLVAGAL
jgi:hypothetical protein